MTGAEYLLASRVELTINFEALLKLLRSTLVKTIYKAKKDGQTYKLILDNNTLIQIWKFPAHLQAKNQFLSKKKAHIRKGWQGATRFVERLKEKIELPEEKERKEVTSSREEKKKRQRYVKILGRKILVS